MWSLGLCAVTARKRFVAAYGEPGLDPGIRQSFSWVWTPGVWWSLRELHPSGRCLGGIPGACRPQLLKARIGFPTGP